MRSIAERPVRERERVAILVGRVPRSVVAALDEIAAQNERSRAGEIRRLLEQHVERERGRATV